MKKITLSLAFILICVVSSAAQDTNIVKIIDELTIAWDAKALKLEAYDGLGHLCRVKTDRDNHIKLLKDIHHHDTVLFQIVTSKYAKSKDAEAKKTLEDIETLEKDYTTKAFLKFIHTECNRFNEIENNFAKAGGSAYKKEIKILEKELSRYVKAITKQIDVIDDHVHHLKKL